MHPAPTSWALPVLGEPAVVITALATPNRNGRGFDPAPQGSKTPTGGGGMRESSKYVARWRKTVTAQAREQVGPDWVPLDGPLVVDMVFTMRHGASIPRWRHLHSTRPDLSKLLRAVEDSLTDAGVWADDARVTEYRRLGKRYVGSPDPDTLPTPGVLVRVWAPGEDLVRADMFPTALGQVAA